MTEYKTFFDVELKQRSLSKGVPFIYHHSIDRSSIPAEGVLLEFGCREYYNDPDFPEYKFREIVSILEGFSKVCTTYYHKRTPCIVVLDQIDWASSSSARNTQIKMKLLGIEPNRVYWFRNDLNDT